MTLYTSLLSIFGYIGNRKASNILINGLQRLEYRGYDSAGICTHENNELIMVKDKALNERDYGSLVGLNKQETANKFGKQKVQIWRRT